MLLDTSLLNIQQYTVRLGVVAIEKGALLALSTTVAKFTITCYYSYKKKKTKLFFY